MSIHTPRARPDGHVGPRGTPSERQLLSSHGKRTVACKSPAAGRSRHGGARPRTHPRGRRDPTRAAKPAADATRARSAGRTTTRRRGTSNCAAPVVYPAARPTPAHNEGGLRLQSISNRGGGKAADEAAAAGNAPAATQLRAGSAVAAASISSTTEHPPTYTGPGGYLKEEPHAFESLKVTVPRP